MMNYNTALDGFSKVVLKIVITCLLVIWRLILDILLILYRFSIRPIYKLIRYIFTKRFLLDAEQTTRKMSKSFIRITTEVLSRNQVIAISSFIILFALTDRLSNRKIKYPKTKAPNLAWRLFAVILYVPACAEFIYPLAINASKLFFGEYYLDQLRRSFFENVFIYYSILRKDVIRIFRSRFDLISIYQLTTYASVRLITAVIPPSIFRMPMFLKYHIMNVSLLCIICQLSQLLLVNIQNLLIKTNQQVIPPTTEIGVLSSFWLVLYIVLIGRGCWDAARGRSFTKAFLDIPVRIHIGHNSLYKDEEWRDYGQDEREGLEGYDF